MFFTSILYAVFFFGMIITALSLFASADDGQRIMLFSLTGLILMIAPFVVFALTSSRDGMSGAEFALFIVAISIGIARWSCIIVIQSRSTKAFERELEVYELRRK